VDNLITNGTLVRCKHHRKNYTVIKADGRRLVVSSIAMYTVDGMNVYFTGMVADN
jgi:hypothetical protein